MRLVLLPLAAVVAGCASLEVEVDVMEPRYASAAALDAGMRIEAADIAASPHALSDMFVDRAFARYMQFRDECLDEVIQAVRARGPEGDQALFDTNIAALTASRNNRHPADVQDLQERARRGLYEADNEVLNAVARAPEAALATRTPAPLPAGLRNALLRRRAAVAGIETELRAQILGQTQTQSSGQEPRPFNCETVANLALQSGIAPETRQALNAKKDQAVGDLAQIARQATITGAGRLLNNNLEAFYITNAPDQLWARRYNRAFGRGMFGSTSIAIVMNDTADFSIKGFVFDGRSTAQMVQKVTTQAVSLIAAASGAPISVRPAGTTSGSPTQFDTARAISANRASLEQAEAETEAYEAALLRIADSVLTNWTALTGANDAQRAAAQGIVSGTVSAYRTSWRNTSQ